MLYDGQQRARFELSENEDTINILPFSEEEKSGAFPTQTLTEESPSISWLFSTEKVVHQEQRRIRDNGREWIEFELKLWRGEHSIAILRVDPEIAFPSEWNCSRTKISLSRSYGISTTQRRDRVTFMRWASNGFANRRSKTKRQRATYHRCHGYQSHENW